MTFRDDLRAATCPVCWGEFIVRDDDEDGVWQLVLHGYTRPGTGHVEGRCPGTDEVPLEHSPAGLEKALADLRTELEQCKPGREHHGIVATRIAFARAELAKWEWEPISGVDKDPDPCYQPRKPPTAEELAERMRLGIGLRGDLKRARNEQAAQEAESRPPWLLVVAEVADEYLDRKYSDRRRGGPDGKLSGKTEEPSPRKETSLVATRSFAATKAKEPRDDIARRRRDAEQELRKIASDRKMDYESERLRLAAHRQMAAWIKTNNLQGTMEASSGTRGPRGDEHQIIVTTAKLKEPDWETAERLGQLLGNAGTRTEERGELRDRLHGIRWTVVAENLNELAEKLGVPPVDMRKVKAKREPAPAYLAWDEVLTWDGSKVSTMELVWYLNKFAAEAGEIAGRWAVPAHIAPFAPWKDGPPLAVDGNGNCLVWQADEDDDARGKWTTKIFGELVDDAVLDRRAERLDVLAKVTECNSIGQPAVGGLDAVSVSEDGRLFLANEETSGWRDRCYRSHRIVALADI